MAGSGVFPKTGSGSGGTDLIYKNDYNTIQTAVAAIKTTFYGVACESSQIGTGTTIKPLPLEWNNLLTDINSCYKHITGSNSAIGSKTVGQLITAANTNAYKTAAEYITTNQGTVYSTTQLSFTSNADSSTRSTGWNSAITYSVRVTFASAAAAGYFFNTGGSFSLYTTATGGSGGTKNTNWKTAIDSVGAYTYTRTDYAAGNKTNTYNVTSYSSSALTVSVTKESATSLLFTAYFNDATGGNPDELIDLTITSALSYYSSVDAIVSPVPSAITKTSDLQTGGVSVSPTYSFGTMPSSINEGSAGTINVNTTDVSNGTTLYWTVTNAGDFGTSSGSFVINSNAGSFTVTPAADSTTEGAETFTVSIRTGSTSGTVVATSSAITINDTSVAAGPVLNTTNIDFLVNGDYPPGAGAWVDACSISAAEGPASVEVEFRSDGTFNMFAYQGGEYISSANWLTSGSSSGVWIRGVLVTSSSLGTGGSISATTGWIQMSTTSYTFAQVEKLATALGNREGTYQIQFSFDGGATTTYSTTDFVIRAVAAL